MIWQRRRRRMRRQRQSRQCRNVIYSLSTSSSWVRWLIGFRIQTATVQHATQHNTAFSNTIKKKFLFHHHFACALPHFIPDMRRLYVRLLLLLLLLMLLLMALWNMATWRSAMYQQNAFAHYFFCVWQFLRCAAVAAAAADSRFSCDGCCILILTFGPRWRTREFRLKLKCYFH